MQTIGIVGVGFVGNAIRCFFESRTNIVCYDKYKQFNKIEELLSTDLIFLCLPTLFDEEKNEYDKYYFRVNVYFKSPFSGIKK